MNSVAPVMKLDASDARKTAAGPSSAGSHTSPLLTLHWQGHGAAAQPGSFEICIDHLVPVFLGKLLDGAADVDSGVVDQDVDSTEPVERPCHHLLHVRAPGDVDAQRKRFDSLTRTQRSRHRLCL